MEYLELNSFEMVKDLNRNFSNIAIIGGGYKQRQKLIKEIFNQVMEGIEGKIKVKKVIDKWEEMDVEKKLKEPVMGTQIVVYEEGATKDLAHKNSYLVLELMYMGKDWYQGLQNIFLYQEADFPTDDLVIKQFDYYFVFPMSETGIEQEFYEKWISDRGYLPSLEAMKSAMENLVLEKECLVMNKSECFFYRMDYDNEEGDNDDENYEERIAPWYWRLMMYIPCVPMLMEQMIEVPL